MADDKTIAVIGQNGVGKRTTMGNLIYKCGGVDLATMGHFEREGSQTYEKVIEGLRGLGKTPSFYTPKRKVIVNDETSSADAVILAVTPTKDTGRPLCQEDINQIQRSASLFKDNKAIILVNKMDSHDWSKDDFMKTIHSIASELGNIGITTSSILSIPVSGLLGDNLLEPSSKIAWYNHEALEGPTALERGLTLIGAIDRIVT